MDPDRGSINANERKKKKPNLVYLWILHVEQPTKNKGNTASQVAED